MIKLKVGINIKKIFVIYAQLSYVKWIFSSQHHNIDKVIRLQIEGLHFKQENSKLRNKCPWEIGPQEEELHFYQVVSKLPNKRPWDIMSLEAIKIGSKLLQQIHNHGVIKLGNKLLQEIIYKQLHKELQEDNN